MHVGYSVNVMCTFTFAVVGCFKIRRYPTLEVGPVYRFPSLAREAGKGRGADQQVHIVMVKFSNKQTHPTHGI